MRQLFMMIYFRSSSSSKSRSRSPERKDSVLFITSFGGESDEDRPVVQGPSLPSTDKPDKWSVFIVRGSLDIVETIVKMWKLTC